MYVCVYIYIYIYIYNTIIEHNDLFVFMLCHIMLYLSYYMLCTYVYNHTHIYEQFPDHPNP